jgi:hypothetical protein
MAVDTTAQMLYTNCALDHLVLKDLSQKRRSVGFFVTVGWTDASSDHGVDSSGA